MFTVFWFLLILFLASYSVVWLIDNNGLVQVNWLGYEMQTDVLTILVITIFLTSIIILLASLLTRILAIKFPALLKYFFKRNYTKNLEKIILKHQTGLEDLTNLLLAIEANDDYQKKKFLKNFSAKIKHKNLNNFLNGKLALISKNYSQVIKYFSQFSGNSHALAMVVEAKYQIAIDQGDDYQAIKYAKQLLNLSTNRLEVAKKLINLYRKNQLWNELNKLQKLFDKGQLDQYFFDDDLTNINIFQAQEFYRQKKFFRSFIYGKKALKKSNKNLQAIKIFIKTMAKLGLRFMIDKTIIRLWRIEPNMILARLYDQNNRKYSLEKRIAMFEKLIAINNQFEVGNLALAKFYFQVSDFKNAKTIIEKIDIRNLDANNLSNFERLKKAIDNQTKK